MYLQLNQIKVLDRIRKDNGDIHELAESIREYGLMNPITVVEINGEYILIAGFRRYSALLELGETGVDASVMYTEDAEDMLRMEYEENVRRKDFTDSEKVAYAEKLRVIEAEKSRKRMGGHNKPDSSSTDKSPEMTTGETRDILAQKVGYNSGKQLERATYVAKNRPDLMEKVDAKEMTVGGAYKQARTEARKALKEEMKKNGMGILTFDDGHKLYGHIGSQEPLGAERYPFVVDSIHSAGHFFLKEIQGTMSRYSEAMISPEHDEELSEALCQIFRSAIDAMGDHYKGPRL